MTTDKTHQPKGGMCVTCKHRDSDCSELPFATMPAIGKDWFSGATIVKCSKHEKEHTKDGSRRWVIVQAIKASKGWVTEFAEAFVDEYLATEVVQQPAVAQGVALYVSPGQLAAHTDPDGDTLHGRYLPARKTPAGKFTQALYTAPALAQSARPGYSLIRSDLIDFLNGSGSLHGLHFGDSMDGKPFWWRRYLTEAPHAQPAQPIARLERTACNGLIFVHGVRIPDFPFGTCADDERQKVVDAINAACTQPDKQCALSECRGQPRCERRKAWDAKDAQPSGEPQPLAKLAACIDYWVEWLDRRYSGSPMVVDLKQVSEQLKATQPAQRVPMTDETSYRMLQRNVDVIEESDEFLGEDAKTWAVDPNGIFVGMTYGGAVIRPARRAVEAHRNIKEQP